MKLITLGTLALALVIHGVAVVDADDYVGCGYPTNPSNCEGCTAFGGTCTCQVFGTEKCCYTNNVICYSGPRTFSAAGTNGGPVFKRSVDCKARRSCNNQSGIDGGSCADSGICNFSDDLQVIETGFEYYTGGGTCEDPQEL